MSADNYYFITKHPNGGWTAIMGFMSDESPTMPSADDVQFRTVAEAVCYAQEDWTEYGVSLSTDAKEHLKKSECAYTSQT